MHVRFRFNDCYRYVEFHPVHPVKMYFRAERIASVYLVAEFYALALRLPVARSDSKTDASVFTL